jgi:hypothetical protein
MVLTNIRIYLKVNERSVDRLGRFDIPAPLQSSRTATGAWEFLAALGDFTVTMRPAICAGLCF